MNVLQECNPLLMKLKDPVDKLHALLEHPEPGLMSWNCFVGDRWKEIVTLWDSDNAALVDLHPLAVEVWVELSNAERHGKTFASLHEAYAVMLEELDEVWFITRQKRKQRVPEHLRKELIQCAAMAIKAIRSMENFVGGDA